MLHTSGVDNGLQIERINFEYGQTNIIEKNELKNRKCRTNFVEKRNKIKSRHRHPSTLLRYYF